MFLSTHPFALIPFDEEVGLAPSDVDQQALWHAMATELLPVDGALLDGEEDIVHVEFDEAGNEILVDANGDPVGDGGIDIY